MNVCVHLFCICVVLCVGSDLATDWSPVQGVLPTVYRLIGVRVRFLTIHICWQLRNELFIKPLKSHTYGTYHLFQH
jgi:hypothetical protein